MVKRRHFLTMMGATVTAGVAACSGDDGDAADGAGIPVAGTNVRDVLVGSVGSLKGRRGRRRHHRRHGDRGRCRSAHGCTGLT